MTPPAPCYCLKTDVDTHDGMRDGVPRMLETLRRFDMRATFFLAFGPDNSGKAIWNVFRSKGFLRKMVKTGAPKLYGWRTMLSGTLLPARPIASAFPDLVRRVAGEGHEVGVHAWDHRLWQDHLDRLTREQVREQFARAFDAYERILGRPPAAVAAPAWRATVVSLQLQDALGLEYASDMRDGPPGYPELDGYRSTTLQMPTTQPCLEELLTLGWRGLDGCADAALRLDPALETCVLPLHAEVEGGMYNAFLEKLLRRVRERGGRVVALRERAAEVRASAPAVRARSRPIAGRAGIVLAPWKDE